MVFADALILVWKNRHETQKMYKDLSAAIRPWTFRTKEEALTLWSNYGGPPLSWSEGGG